MPGACEVRKHKIAVVPRLLCCTDTYPPQVNGVSIVTALSIAGLIERGWECAVVAPQYPGGTEYAADERLTTIPSLALPIYPDIRLALPSPWRIRDAIREFKPDLVHCATEFVIGQLGQREARRAGIPAVSSYHTDFARYTVSYGMPWLHDPVMNSIVRFHARSRRTYTPGSPAAGDLRSHGVRDVEVWGRGVDTHVFRPDRRDAALRARLGIGGRFTFLHVGRLAAEKGVQLILDAYRAVSSALPPDTTRLIVAGEGPERDALRAAAPPGTRFLGFIDRQNALPALYASCDAFCFASTTETLGLVILEAMACGLPVLAAPAGGVADHLRDGVNGIAYPANDTGALASAMVQVATQPERRLALASGARATAEQLTWTAELDRLDQSYRAVLMTSSESASGLLGAEEPVASVAQTGQYVP